MNAKVSRRADASAARTVTPSAPSYDDPLDPDDPLDLVVTTTRRSLCRLTMLATEIGCRFERDGEVVEPMAWLLAPRRLFNGQAAIDACLERDHFMRAYLLHSLAMGMDAEPPQLDELLEDDGFSKPGGVAVEHRDFQIH